MTWLVISDLDGTLLGDDDALAQFAEWCEEQGPRVLLAYSSGRSFESVSASIRETRLPEPVAVIGNVGTQICRYPSGAPIGGWPQADASEWSAARVRAALADVCGLTPQPDRFQSPFKVSYFLHEATPRQLQAVRSRLASAQLAADIVYSSQRDLDVLPRGANKGSAARYLTQALGIADEGVVVCGDTGNDLAMFQAGYRGVVVGNALPELKEAASLSNHQRVYQAQSCHAGGVLEGMRHWMHCTP